MNKKILLFLSLLLYTAFISCQAQQSKPQALFDEANQHLQQGDITNAIQRYNRLQDQNYQSGALFLNLGLSYVKIDSMGKAKYYFLKARQFEETEQRAAEGLVYVENQFSHQSAVLPTLPWQKALNWLEDVAGSILLLAIGLLLLNLGVFLYITLWFIHSESSFLPRVAITGAITGLLVVLLSFYVDYRNDRYDKAVMTSRETTVREEPAPDAAIVNQAFEGYDFKVDRHKSGDQQQWAYIQMSNGQYGWIPSSKILIL